MANVFVVRAEFGTYTDHFLKGGFAGIGWVPEVDLSAVANRDELYPIYRSSHPEDTSNVVIGQQVGQIARFLLEIKGGDYVIVPSSNTDIIYYGVVEPDPSYEFVPDPTDGCKYTHRRRIKWNTNGVMRKDFSVPFQNSIRSSLTVFKVDHEVNFFETIGKPQLLPKRTHSIDQDYYTIVLNRILELDDKEFEILITHLLSSLGFEAEHKGKTGDGGVDATGELDIFNVAKIKLFVQAKRYKLGAKISANAVKSLRQNIPNGAQGAFITTCKYHPDAQAVANESGFARIGLIDGENLVEILAAHWDDIPEEFREKLNLRLGLVLK